jgi:N-methylhydantoinase A/oxoprolinase/acetone carboxylase beta subunit
MKIRIGIDVGGTFTDAVAIDDSNYDLIGKVKILTTHRGKDGVALGVIRAIKEIMEKYNIKQEDIVFIAYGTTQATNALLEGDVATVGVIGLGQGIEGIKAKNDTQVGDIELAKGRYIKTFHRFVPVANENLLEKSLYELKKAGCSVIVACAAFSVDDPSTEKAVIAKSLQTGLPATGSHTISKLYGLKMRTRTAVINASILPKMMETADITERSVELAGIRTPLMIMRCDGGVIEISAIRERPILTLLSGPAAGVAGALMYEKISNGIFLEVGGTSTDISAIRNGKVMFSYADVGGHKTYLHSLDIRTVGIGGGSMIRIDDYGVMEVGPRSAHIAGLDYAVYANPDDIIEPEIILMQPKLGDPIDYAMIQCANGKKYAITLSCAANILGYVKQGDYAYGSKEAAYKAFMPFAAKYGVSVEDFAKAVMEKVVKKNMDVLKNMICDYNFETSSIVLVGGGGAAAVVVPHLAGYMGVDYRIAKNAEVISPIGVALAMVREVVERNIVNPTEKDILLVRKEAEQAAIRAGADIKSIELSVEVDVSRNIVRSIATGATELRTKERSSESLTLAQILNITARAMNVQRSEVQCIANTGDIYIIQGKTIIKKWFGLYRKISRFLYVIDYDGMIRVRQENGNVFRLSVQGFDRELGRVIEENMVYSDGGRQIPDVFLIYGGKMLDLSGLITKEQIISIANLEIKGLDEDSAIYSLVGGRAIYGGNLV